MPREALCALSENAHPSLSYAVHQAEQDFGHRCLGTFNPKKAAALRSGASILSPEERCATHPCIPPDQRRAMHCGRGPAAGCSR